MRMDCGKHGWDTAQFHLLFDPRGTFTARASEVGGDSKGTVCIGAGQAEFAVIGCRENHAAGVKFLQQIAQLRESKKGNAGEASRG